MSKFFYFFSQFENSQSYMIPTMKVQARMMSIQTKIVGFLWSIALVAAGTSNTQNILPFVSPLLLRLPSDAAKFDPLEFLLRGGGDRHLQAAQGNCTQDPFLWHIYRTTNNNNNGTDAEEEEEHVGFGVGTVHLPVNIVLEDLVWRDIQLAIQSSCTVYGELNMRDATVNAEIKECFTNLLTTAAKVSDIPSPALREMFEYIMREIALDLVPAESVDAMMTAFREFPILNFLQMVSAYNTPSYWPIYRDTILGGAPVLNMDESILAMGQTTGGLEEVETQCQLMRMLTPTLEAFATNFTDAWEAQLALELTYSLEGLRAAYSCGDLSIIEEMFVLEDASSSILTQMLDGECDKHFHRFARAVYKSNFTLSLAERNTQMVRRMLAIMETSTTKPLFAVGLAHWTTGPFSFQALLEAEGYRLERVVSGSLKAENLSDVACESDFAAESKSYVESKSIGGKLTSSGARFQQPWGLLGVPLVLLWFFSS